VVIEKAQREMREKKNINTSNKQTTPQTHHQMLMNIKIQINKNTIYKKE
jgi:hypothetical protein